MREKVPFVYTLLMLFTFFLIILLPKIQTHAFFIQYCYEKRYNIAIYFRTVCYMKEMTFLVLNYFM